MTVNVACYWERIEWHSLYTIFHFKRQRQYSYSLNNNTINDTAFFFFQVPTALRLLAVKVEGNIYMTCFSSFCLAVRISEHVCLFFFLNLILRLLYFQYLIRHILKCIHTLLFEKIIAFFTPFCDHYVPVFYIAMYIRRYMKCICYLLSAVYEVYILLVLYV